MLDMDILTRNTHVFYSNVAEFLLYNIFLHLLVQSQKHPRLDWLMTVVFQPDDFTDTFHSIYFPTE